MLCSDNRSPYSNEDKQITTAHNNLHDSHEQKVKYKKPDIKDFRLYNSIYINYKNKPVGGSLGWMGDMGSHKQVA